MKYCEKCSNMLSSAETYKNIKENDGANYQLWICDDCQSDSQYDEQTEYTDYSDADIGL